MRAIWFVHAAVLLTMFTGLVVKLSPPSLVRPPVTPIRGVKERRMTEEEYRRCAREVNDLGEMKVSFGVAETDMGFPLAVLKATDVVSDSLLRTGQWELLETQRAFNAFNAIGKGCEEPPCEEKVFLDVGTNVGTWTFLAAKNGWHTVSVEGSPSNFALLKLSRCLNPELAGRVNLVNSFVSEGSEYCLVVCDLDNETDVMLKCQDHPWTAAEKAAEEHRLLNVEKRRSVRLTPTMTRRMDDVVADTFKANPHLPRKFHGVKMDIEGSELMAARGAPRLTATSMPVIFSEICYDIRGGPHPDAYFNHMRAAGYELRDPSCQITYGPEHDTSILTRLKRTYIENVCYVKVR